MDGKGNESVDNYFSMNSEGMKCGVIEMVGPHSIPES